MRELRYNTAVIVPVGPFLDKGDGVSIKTSLTITNEKITLIGGNNDGSAPTLILDNITGATSGTDNDLNYVANSDNGMMGLELTAANLQRYGYLFLTVTDAPNHVPVFHEFLVVSQAYFDWKYGSGNAPVEVKAIANDIITAAAFDESTAFPLKYQDASSTIIARPGNAMALTSAYDAAKAAASQSSVDTIDGIVDAIIARITATRAGNLDVLADLLDAGRLDVLIDAIKAKTDNLPASPANETTLTTLHGHIDDILGDTAEIQAEMADGGRTDILIDGIKAKTDNLPSDPADQSQVEAAISAAHATTNGKVDAAKAVIDNIHDTDLPAVKADSAAIKDKTDANLDATVSSRLPTASYSVAPSAASIEALLSANHGAGAWGASAVGTIAYPDPLDPFEDENHDPMVGVKIECFSNSERTALVDVQITDVNGNFQFHLNAGEYWFRASLLQHVSYEWFMELVAVEEE